MADNVQITEGTGTAVHADEFTDATYGLGKSQQVKIADGTPGSGNKLIVDTNGSAQVEVFDANGVSAIGEVQASPTANTLLDRLKTIATNVANATLSTGYATGANSLSVTGAANEVRKIQVTPTISTSAYTAGDLLFDATAIAACVKANDGSGILTDLTMIDEDSENADIELYFLSASTSLGTANAAAALTDAMALTILGRVDIFSTDYVDVGDSNFVYKSNLNIAVTPASGTDDVYVAAIVRTAPTYTATTDLKFRFGFL